MLTIQIQYNTIQNNLACNNNPSFVFACLHWYTYILRYRYSMLFETWVKHYRIIHEEDEEEENMARTQTKKYVLSP